MFSDLHCHPALYTFNRLRNTGVEDDPSLFNPWCVSRSNTTARAKARRATRYSQVSPPMMAQGNLRVAYASITPIEKGFFHGGDNPTDWITEAVAMATGITPLRAARHLLLGNRDRATEHAVKILKNPGPFRSALQRIFLGYPMSRVRHLQSTDYDYWEEFQLEYQFYKNADGERTNDGWYRLVDSPESLAETIDGGGLAMVHTIEGGHTFSVDRFGNRRSVDEIEANIDHLKSLDWPLLFLTLAHHFDNGICGHAKSLMDLGALVIDQEPRMNADFDELIGKRIVRRLLGITKDMEDDGTRRILIDCKHMSARARQTYYRSFIHPYNELHPDRKIPVIHSHAGYSGITALSDFIENEEKERDGYFNDDFLSWSINYCDEDIFAVHESEGLIGLCFDRRIMAADRRRTKRHRKWSEILIDHIFATVDVVWSSGLPDREKIWDRIMIGSDFDGMIDPLERYPTAVEFATFRRDLAWALEAQNTTRGISSVGVDQIVDKICWKNGYDFAARHLSVTPAISEAEVS